MLALLLFLGAASALQTFPVFNSNLCVPSSTTQAIPYNEYVASIDSNLTFDPVQGTWSVTTYELCNPSVSTLPCKSVYQLEAVRRNMDSTCGTCPYDQDPYYVANDPYSTTGQFLNMFGPCFDATPPLQTVCVQHPALNPQTFMGTYHYPMQMPLTDAIWLNSIYQGQPSTTPVPVHTFLGTDSPWITQDVTAKNPSQYGLGKASVEASRDGVRLINKTTNQQNDQLTAAFLQPYRQVNGVEQWIKWAQFFCYPGCHKDSMMQYVIVRQIDITQHPENYYLAKYVDSGNELMRCARCQKYDASYNWDESNDAPFDPRANIFALQCYPWFGAVPSVNYTRSRGYFFNSIFLPHSTDSDGVSEPAAEERVVSVACPVNTYNRVCAHTKRRFFWTAPDKYPCTPCPPGYHTAGLQGQWYCRPPPGNLFTFQPLSVVTNVWGNRDLLSRSQTFRELECGYLPQHCMQEDCNGMLPDEYNEHFVFDTLLKNRPCASGSYCPDAFTEIGCPFDRPWSPAGSSSLQNCSCAAGKYMSPSGACLPCTPACTQTTGYYLPQSLCLLKNGATADAPCQPCTNLPPANATPTGNGWELAGAGGICPFTCAYGCTLGLAQPDSQLSLCVTRYLCSPVTTPPTGANGKYVFYSAPLPTDGLTVVRDGSGVTCNKAPLLTNALQTQGSPWQPQTLSCFGQCAGGVQQLCYAQPSTAPLQFPSMPWYALDAIVQCKSCPSPSLLPSNAIPAVYVALDKPSCVGGSFIQCTTPGSYFNASAWACQSCLERQALVCPNSTRLRGQGCLGVQTPFNRQAPSADCIRCTLPLPAADSKTFLNYISVNGTEATGGCAYEQCAASRPTFYWSVACGGDVQGTQLPCHYDCLAGQYLASACTTDADRICRNCTTWLPGSHQLYDCVALADSQWEPCQAGFYCLGGGSQLQCPPLRTSQPGAKALSDCYCKVGMRENEAGTCVPYQCQGTVQDPALPGPSLRSAYYMTLDPTTLASTTCLPCGGGASTWGAGVELASCMCPLGLFASLNTSRTIQCLPSCPAPTCTDPLMLPTPCTRSLRSNACQCAFQPFWGLLPNQQQAGTSCSGACLSGYMPTGAQSRPLRGEPRVSGSMVYVTDAAWTPLATQPQRVVALATTGVPDELALVAGVYHVEYVFWSTQDSPFISAQTLAANGAQQQWQLYGTATDWQNNTYAIQAVAVSRWDVVRLPHTLYVAAVVLVSGGGKFKLMLSISPFDYGQFPDTQASSSNTTLYSGTTGISVVGLTHSSTGVTDSAEPLGGYFYVAYNLGGYCGGLLLVSPFQQQVLTSVPGICPTATSPPLQSVAVRLDPAQPSTKYTAVYALVGGALYRLTLGQGTMPASSLIAPSPGGGLLVSLSSTALLLLNTSGLQGADTQEWAWVSMAGMPQGTAPFLLSATPITPTTATLVAAYGGGIYTLGTTQCAVGFYWDGVGCTAQACTQVQQCDATRTLVNNMCVCLPGFFQTSQTLPCSQCLAPSYCNGGTKKSCPSGLATVAPQASSDNDCLCPATGQYASSATGCSNCPPNFWCPDRWGLFQCPGTASSSSTGAQFPIGCGCLPGYTGPNCALCPAGFYCPLSSTASASNMAVYYAGVPPDAIALLRDGLFNFFTLDSSRIATVNSPADLDSVLYVKALPATNHTPQALMVMVQVPSSLQQKVTGWGGLLKQLFDAAHFNYTLSGQPIQQSAPTVNVPVACLTGKVPSSPVPSTCVCAPGYQTSGQQCAACPANYYKAPSGAGTCIPCAVGLTTNGAVGASACVNPPPYSPPSDGGGSPTVLIGAVAGGIVGLLALLYIMQAFIFTHAPQQ